MKEIVYKCTGKCENCGHKITIKFKPEIIPEDTIGEFPWCSCNFPRNKDDLNCSNCKRPIKPKD